MLENVIGQTRAKQMLGLLGKSYDRRGNLPPIAVFGPSGLGKTHLMSEWAEELGVELHYLNGTSLKDAMAFREFIQNANRDTSKYHIVFVDECHNLPKKVQENLLSVLEEPHILCTVAPREIGNVRMADGRTKFVEKGDIMREKIPTNMSFCFATTDPAKMQDTILNRLRKVQLEPYSEEEKVEIAMHHMTQEGFPPSIKICTALAARSRSIRHLKVDLCETFIDVCNYLGADDDDAALEQVDSLLGVDSDGATDQDRDYMEFLATNNKAGVDTLAGKLKCQKEEVVTRIEPFLLEKGWILITGRGRMLTPAGRTKIFGTDYVDEITS